MKDTEFDGSWEAVDSSPKGKEPTGSFDRLFRTAFFLALLLIAFVTGGLLTAANLFPGTSIADAYKGGKALYQQMTTYQNVYNTDLWYPERTKEKGVTTYDPALAQPGLTLYTSGQAASAFLIDMNGKIVHQWHKPFSEVWTPASGIKRPVPDSNVYFRKALVYPNGDLLAVYEGAGDTPYGYGLVKLDKDSNVLWTFWGRTHHDVDIGPDGRIYALIQGFVDKPDRDFTNLATPRLLDSVVILSPEGKLEKTIPLFPAVANSNYRNTIFTVSSYAVADPLHANHVRYITRDMARNFPYAKPGQLLVSFRELGLIGVLDPDTGKLVWGARGPWIGQHDPEILPNGNITMFDNYGNLIPNFRRTSRVIEVDPKTLGIVWKYAGTQDNPLGSLIRGAALRLKNGNTLITESSGGRIVEVTPDKKIAWEYINPVRGSDADHPPQIPIICWAQRIDPATLDPAFLNEQKSTQTNTKD